MIKTPPFALACGVEFYSLYYSIEETKFSLFEHWLLKNVYLSGVGGEKATSKREQRRFTCFAEQKWFHVINPLM